MIKTPWPLKYGRLFFGSKKELMVAVTFIPTQPIKQILPTFETHIDHKVKIQLITTCDTEKTLPDAIFALPEVRIHDDMFEGGLVADGHETLLLLS